MSLEKADMTMATLIATVGSVLPPPGPTQCWFLVFICALRAMDSSQVGLYEGSMSIFLSLQEWEMKRGLGWTNTQSWAGQRGLQSCVYTRLVMAQDNICHECAMHTKHTHSICCAQYTLHGTHTQHTEYTRTWHMHSV